MTHELSRDYTTRPGSTAYILGVWHEDESRELVGVMVDVTSEAAEATALQLTEERRDAGGLNWPVDIAEVPVYGEPLPRIGEVVTGYARLHALPAGTVIQWVPTEYDAAHPGVARLVQNVATAVGAPIGAPAPDRHVWVRLAGDGWSYSGATAEAHADAFKAGASEGAPWPDHSFRILYIPTG